MKVWMRGLFVVGLAWTAGGCAATGAYFKDRGRDAMDMATLGVEWAGVGASLQAGPVKTGLMGAMGYGAGLLGRDIGHYALMDFQAVIGGITYLLPESNDPVRREKLHAATFLMIVADPSKEGFDFHEDACGRFQMVVMAGVGVRVGIDVFEILDFFAGWAGADLLKDDSTETE